MLILARKLDQKIKIGDNVTVTIIDIRGDHVKVGIDAPQDVRVFRQEVFNAIQAQNQEAASETPDTSMLRSLFG